MTFKQTHHFRHLLIYLVLLCVAGMAWAEAAHASEQKRIRLTDASGKTFSGNQVWLKTDEIQLQSDPEKKPGSWHSSDLLRIVFPQNKNLKKALSRKIVLFLQNGDRVIVDFCELREEEFVVSWNLLPAKKRTFSIPMETVLGLRFLSASEKVDDQLLNQRLKNEQNNDLLIFKNGDTISGELEKMHKLLVIMKKEKETLTVEHDTIQQLLMNREFISFTDVPEKHWILHLVDGSRLTVTHCQSVSYADVINVTTAFGTKLTISQKMLSSIDLLGGKGVYLSRLKATKFQHQPFLPSLRQIKQSAKQIKYDRNITGKRLQLRGVVYRYGIGMCSRSTATWQLNKKYQTFRATIGIDDATAGKGDVRFIVKVDGKVTYKSERVTGSSAAILLPTVNVLEAKQLTLIVDYGQRGDIFDHANWCDAILVKNRKKN